jgi:hypothetical protein
MSIAEFYTEEGIDPSDPGSMANFLAMRAGYAEAMISDVSQQPPVPPSVTLNESELDSMAEARAWEKLDCTSSEGTPMVSYRKDNVRLEVWLSTGTIGSYLEHPNQGKTQLFLRNIMQIGEATEIFDNPHVHSNKGYNDHRQHEQIAAGGHQHMQDGYQAHSGGGRGGGGGRSRGPCRFGESCNRPDCWFDHPYQQQQQQQQFHGGYNGGGGGGGGKGPCRYSSQCTRPNCWFDH